MRRSLAIALVLACSGIARAESVVLRPSDRAEEIAYRTLISFDGTAQVLIEEAEISAQALDVGWIRAFPTKPELITAPPDTFTRLSELGRVEQPHRDEVRGRLFGPSLVTLIIDRLAPAGGDFITTVPSTAAPLALGEVSMWTGPLETSTVTGLPLVDPVADWMSENGYTASRETLSAISAYLATGWTIVARGVRVNGVSRFVRGRVGPIGYRFPTTVAIHPVLTSVSRPNPDVRFDYYTHAARGLTPTGVETSWDERGWEGRTPNPGEFVVRSLRDVEPSALDGLGLPPIEGAKLLAAELRFKDTPLRDLELAPSEARAVLPESGERGDLRDVLLCILLGLAPLLYTPESWFFLWLGARARERARLGLSAGLLYLWPIYALVVAVYWIATQSGLGRAAAVLPALIAVFRIASGRPELSPRPVRARFKAKGEADKPAKSA